MIGIFLSLTCFYGYVITAWQNLKIPLRFAPFFSISLIGTVLYFLALTNHLQFGTSAIIYLGYFLLALQLIKSHLAGEYLWRNNQFIFFFSLFSLLTIINFLYSTDMPFSVIDDYVYWGIMGKYLNLHHHLPDSQTSIIPRHLAYTPGASLIHYFFYRIFNHYSPAISFFAQNFILFASLLVAADFKKIKQSIISICLIIILTTLMFGSILAKLSTDHLLAVFFFALLWVSYSSEDHFIKIFSMSLPLIFLFLLKEVGFFLGIAALIISAYPLLKSSPKDKHCWARTIISIIVLGLIVFMVKLSWLTHCQDMGFSQFLGTMGRENILSAMDIWGNPNTRNGFIIFAKAISIGPADRLKLPYLFWYFILFIIWRNNFKKAQKHEKGICSYYIFTSALLLILYLIMLYFMQVAFFKVGESFDHDVGLTRYLNIFFAGLVLFSVTAYFVKNKLYQGQTKILWSLICVFITCALLISSRNQRIKQDMPDIEAEHFADMILSRIKINDQTKICVINDQNENLLGIRLLYHLQPGMVNYTPFPSQSEKSFLEELSRFDYCLIQKIDPPVNHWLQNLTMENDGTEGLFKINSSSFQGSMPYKISMERIF